MAIRLSDALNDHDSFVPAPNKGIRLSEAISEDKSALEQHFSQQMPYLFPVARDGKVFMEPAKSSIRSVSSGETFSEAPQKSFIDTYRDQLKKNPQPLEAFTQGVLPLGKSADMRAALAAEHPIAYAVGNIASLIAAGSITAPLGAAVTASKPLMALPTLARVAGGRMAQSGTAFMLKSLSDNMAEIVSGDKKSFDDVLNSVVSSTAFGAGAGAVGSIPAPLARIPAEAAYGFTAAKVSGANLGEAVLNGVLFAVMGAFNAKNYNAAYRRMAMAGARQAMVDRMVVGGVPKDIAEPAAQRYFQQAESTFTLGKNGEYNLPTVQEYDIFAAKMRENYKANIEPVLNPESLPGSKPSGQPAESASTTPPPETIDPELRGLTTRQIMQGRDSIPKLWSDTENKLLRLAGVEDGKKIYLGDLPAKVLSGEISTDIAIGQIKDKMPDPRRPWELTQEEFIKELKKPRINPLPPDNPSNTKRLGDMGSDAIKLPEASGYQGKSNAPVLSVEEKKALAFKEYTNTQAEILKKTGLPESDIVDIAQFMGDDWRKITLAAMREKNKVVRDKLISDAAEKIKADAQEPDKIIAKLLSDEIADGEGPKNIWFDEKVVGRLGSSYPLYFQNKGYTRKETLGILDKVISGKKLTPKQETIYNDLKSGILNVISKQEEHYVDQINRIAEGSGVDKAFIESRIQKLVEGVSADQGVEGIDVQDLGQGQEAITDVSKDVLQDPEKYNISNEVLNYPSESEVAYASEKSQKDNLQEIKKDLSDIRSSGPIRPQDLDRIAEELESRGFIDYRGFEIKSPQDVAEIAALFRHPKIEQFQVLLFKDNILLAHNVFSSGAAAHVMIDDDLIERVNKSAGRLKADAIYFAHNHPSGNPKPSMQDMHFTAYASRKMGDIVKGHIVTNGEKYSFINKASGEWGSQEHSFSVAKENYRRGLQKVHHEGDVVVESKKFLEQDKRSILFLDHANHIISVDNIGLDIKTLTYIKEQKKHYACERYIVVQPASLPNLSKEDLPDGILDYISVGKLFSRVEGIGPGSFPKQDLKDNYYRIQEPAGQYNLNDINKSAKDIHKEHVLRALKNGDPVPENVLKDYPEFQDNQWKLNPPPTGRGGITPPAFDFSKWKDTASISILGRHIDTPQLLSFETPERVLEAVAGKDAQRVKDFVTEPIKKNETDRAIFITNLRNNIKETMDSLGIKYNTPQDQAVMAYGERRITIEDLKKEMPNDWEDITKAADYFRGLYDMLLDEVNAVRSKFGYEPIHKRSDYFRHYQELGNALTNFPQLLESDNIPTSIAAKSNIFNPGKPFTTAELQRNGGPYTESAIGGMDNYIDAVSKQIFHTDSVQRVRILQKYIENQSEEKDTFVHLPLLVNNLQEYGNLLAGKKGFLDRGAEKIVFGRGIYSVMQFIQRRTSANMIGANISSAMMNLIPFTQSIATADKIAFGKGILESASTPWNTNDLTIDGVRSELYARRYPENKIALDFMGKAEEATSSLFRLIDQFSAKSIIAGKYYELVDKGIDKAKAMHEADNYAMRILADRSWGQLPVIFGQKILSPFTQFQVEVANLYSNIIKDIPQQYHGDTKKIFNAWVVFMVASWIVNNIYEQVMGRRPTVDPIYAMGTVLGMTPKGKDQPVPERIYRAGKDVIDNLPFSGMFSGGRLPIGAGMPNVANVLRGKSSVASEMAKPLAYWALPFGGGQIKKSLEGMGDYAKGEATTASGKTRYEIEQNFSNFMRSVLFGKYSFPEFRDYINGQENSNNMYFLKKDEER